MTIQCSVYCGASVDGFIAGPNGEIDWLHRPEFDTASTTGLVYDEFISSVDAIVMGRGTFETVMSFKTWPYTLPVVVLSSTLRELPGDLRGKARLSGGSPEEIVQQLAAEGHRHLYIDGGQTIQRFLRARLITDITVTYLPILLGVGIPLFGSIGIEAPMKLVQATSKDDIVQVRYRLLVPSA